MVQPRLWCLVALCLAGGGCPGLLTGPAADDREADGHKSTAPECDGGVCKRDATRGDSGMSAGESGATPRRWGDPVGGNLVANPGFETLSGSLPSSWTYSSGPTYSSEVSQHVEGSRSLKVVDSNGSRALINQSLTLQPGRMYAYEASMKTANLQGAANICVEWSDAAGYLGGDYSATVDKKVSGTTDWTTVHALARIPTEATKQSVSGYLSGAQVGTAWWDAFSVRRAWQPVVYSLLKTPKYRGWIFDTGPDHLSIRYLFAWDDVPGGRGAVHLRARLTSSTSDTTITSKTAQDLPQTELTLDIPLPTLAAGAYSLKSEIVNTASGAVIYRDVKSIQRRAGSPPRIHVNGSNRLIVDGTPFFPLGMYWSNVSEADLIVYTEAPFNTIMPYTRINSTALDLAHKHGIKILYSIKDLYHGYRFCPSFVTSVADEETHVRKIVRDYRSHPALLGWYLNDEMPLSFLPRLEAHYQWVREEDDEHPACIVHFMPGDFVVETDTADAFGSDPYPADHAGAAVDLPSQWTREARQSLAGARPVWMVPQARAFDTYAPTQAQMRSMAWQCIAEGAMGLIFYSWFDLRSDKKHAFSARWADLKQVVKEISAMTTVLLSVDPAPAPQVTGPTSIHSAVRRSGGMVYLITVNDRDQAASAKVLFPTHPKGVTLNGTAVTLATDGSFTASLAPLGVNIYQVTP